MKYGPVTCLFLFQAKQLQPNAMEKYKAKLGSNWVNCINSFQVIFAGSGQFDLTPLDFLVVLQLVVVGEEADSKVGVNAQLGVN